MSPEDLDEAADALREAYYKGTLWATRIGLPLPTIANNLLAYPRSIREAFVWYQAEELICAKGVRWKDGWFDEYGYLSHEETINKGAFMVMEVLKRLRAPQKNVNLEDYV